MKVARDFTETVLVWASHIDKYLDEKRRWRILNRIFWILLIVSYVGDFWDLVKACLAFFSSDF